jgi:predicted Rossmann fold flavoprotein
MTQKVAVIGGGAAGFFAAISAKQHYPDAQVTLFEKSNKLLAKVKVSGGGRCNVTHACFNNHELVKFYPRGHKKLKPVFDHFNVQATFDWFESRGVNLKTEADNRVFPVTDSSQTIIDALMGQCKTLGVTIQTGHAITAIKPGEPLGLVVNGEMIPFTHVIIASGGSPKLAGLDWLKALEHDISSPVPSLFTFNMPNESIKKLMGLSVPNAQVKVLGTKLVQHGPLLITHWGMSGPAILKTSAWGARALAELNYDFNIQVNWLGGLSEDEFRSQFGEEVAKSGMRLVKNKNPFGLPERLWLFFLDKADVSPDKPWAELAKKEKNKLINILTNDQYAVKGKTTFKEEFVTCGGVSLASVNMKTMESRKVPNLYFAGEVLDIDGVTGGFNFQAAWATGFVAGKLSH